MSTIRLRLDEHFENVSRVLFLCVLLAAPWPFGSATPVPAMVMAAAMLLLGGAFLTRRLLKGERIDFPSPAWFSMILALALFQLVVLPAGLSDLGAPAVANVYRSGSLAGGLPSPSWHPVTIDPFATRVRLFQLAGFISAFYLASQLFRRSSDRRLAAYCITLVGLAVALFAVYQKARWGNVLYGHFPVPSATPYGPFVNHNHFAGFVEASALMALGTALGTARRNPSLAVLIGGIAAMMGIAHLLSHSRGGLLAAAVGIVLLAAAYREPNRADRRWILIGALAIGCFLFVWAPSSLFQRISTLAQPGSDESIRFRLGLWSDSISLFGDAPIAGTGLGSYSAAIPRYRTDLDETRAEFAESDWIQLACETGLIGLALIIGLAVSLLGRARRLLRREGSPGLRGIRYGSGAAVLALAVHGLYDFNLHIPSNALLFAIVFGLLVTEPIPRDEIEPPAEARFGRLRPLRYPIAALVSVGIYFAATESLLLGESQQTAREVDPLLTQPEDFADRIQMLERSRQLVPQNPETYFLLGRLYNEEAYRSEDHNRYRDLRFDQARESFHTAINLGPARGKGWFELAWTEANRGNDERADALFLHALKLEPQWSGLRANYALYLASRHRIEEAIAELREGHRLEPGLTSLECIHIIGPYVGDDQEILRRAAGDGVEGDEALKVYQSRRLSEASE